MRMRAPGGRPAAGNRSKPSAPSGKEAHSAPSPTKTQILTDLALKDLTPTEVVCVGEWRGPGTWGGGLAARLLARVAWPRTCLTWRGPPSAGPGRVGGGTS